VVKQVAPRTARHNALRQATLRTGSVAESQRVVKDGSREPHATRNSTGAGRRPVALGSAVADNFRSAAGSAYDQTMSAKRRGPGLAKTRRLPIVREQTLQLWEAADYRCRELFESADVMSEGATRSEPDGIFYYGSTSVVLPVVSCGGLIPDEQVDRVASALRGDPHARVRAIRIAYLEAQLRAQAPIGRLLADVVVRRDRSGVRLDVEVEARVAHGQNASTSRESRAPKRRTRRTRS
jgi:hypothetical protein